MNVTNKAMFFNTLKIQNKIKSLEQPSVFFRAMFKALSYFYDIIFLNGSVAMSNLTKKSLASALKQKIKEKDLSEITIAELTDRCGLKRQTFYYHFTDIYDLLKWLYTNEVIEEIKDAETYESWKECYSYIFEYVKRNQSLIFGTYKSIAKEYFHNFLNNQTHEIISKVIAEKTRNKKITASTEIFLTNFYKNVLIGFIKDWIEEGMREDPASLIEKIDCILDGSIELYIKNSNERNRIQ